MPSPSSSRAVLLIHGGAGTLSREAMTPERADAFHAGLAESLRAGHAILAAGGSALDAVTAAVQVMEDDPLFNAGRGAVYTTDARHEMDAAVMEGSARRAGAVTSICGPRYPVLAARAVMEQTEHVLLAGDGAERFCRDAGLEFCPPDWFGTRNRLDALQAEMRRRAKGLADDGDQSRKHGTVGAVALDSHGTLAAATSTGGMTAKRPGRVGDTPVIGAGTWADNRTCAVSCTGHGEYFIRYAVGHELDARMRWGGQALTDAATALVEQELAAVGGSGGLIAVAHDGSFCLPFNSVGMYRGFVRTEQAVLHTGLFRDGERQTPA